LYKDYSKEYRLLSKLSMETGTQSIGLATGSVVTAVIVSVYRDGTSIICF